MEFWECRFRDSPISLSDALGFGIVDEALGPLGFSWFVALGLRVSCSVLLLLLTTFCVRRLESDSRQAFSDLYPVLIQMPFTPFISLCPFIPILICDRI